MTESSKVRWIGASAIVVVAIAVAGVSVWAGSGSSADDVAVATPAVVTTTVVPAGIDVPGLTKMAREIASENGDGSPSTATVVKTDRAAVLAFEGDVGDTSIADTPVILLQVHGAFKINSPAVS